MRLLLAAFALATVPLAQDVRFNARVLELGAPSFCPGFQYAVDSAPVLLQGNGLDAVAGTVVELRGIVVPSLCPLVVVDVTAIHPATATLSACGTPAVGCPIRFKVGPPTISLNALFAGLGEPGFLPIGELGVLFLTPPLFFLGDAGVAGTFDISIPPNAALIGSTITFQGSHLEVGPISGPAMLTQPLGLTVLPPSLLCFDPTSCE